MAETVPFWLPGVHGARRPYLVARSRIATALRAWFAGQDFIEVETAVLQVSPGNETHLHAFASDLIGLGGERRTLYLRTSPEFACKKLLAGGSSGFSTSPACFVIASAARCITLSSRCWSGTGPRPLTRR